MMRRFFSVALLFAVLGTASVNANAADAKKAAEVSKAVEANPGMGKRCVTCVNNMVASVWQAVRHQHPYLSAAGTAALVGTLLYNYNDNFKNGLRLMFGIEQLDEMAERCGCSKPKPKPSHN